MLARDEDAGLRLLVAVDALTVQSHERHAYKDKHGVWQAHTVTVPSLLAQLADAVLPSSNSDQGSAALKSTRAVVDSDALYKWAKMASLVADWCRKRHVTVVRGDVSGNLRRWYTSTLPDLGFTPWWHIGKLHGWAEWIRDTLDPGKSFEAHVPCPICGVTSWGDRYHGGSQWPIEVRYRLAEDGYTMTDERATCRVCTTVWEGHDSVLELAEEAHEKAAT